VVHRDSHDASLAQAQVHQKHTTLLMLPLAQLIKRIRNGTPMAAH